MPQLVAMPQFVAMPQLVAPRRSVAESVRAAAQQFGDDAQETYTSAVAGLADDQLDDYVESLLAETREATARPVGYVASTHLWWVSGSEFLGRVHIRHRLTPFLRDEGGHLGYHVVACHRRQGHATAMLRAALPIAADLGIECLLITCDGDNDASRKVIEANGGLLWDARGRKLRFWVPTS